MNDVNKEVCDIHTTRFETLLAQHDEAIKSLTECTQKLTYIISAQVDKQKEIDARLKNIENRPNAVFETIIASGITALVSVVITLFFSHFF